MISTAERTPTVRAMCYASGRFFFLGTLDFSIDIWSLTFSVPAVCRARSATFALASPLRTGPRKVRAVLDDDSNFVRVCGQRLVAHDCLRTAAASSRSVFAFD